MDDISGTKETLCTHCAHLAVCAYKHDYLDIFKEVENATMKMANHEFIGVISVGCKYYQETKYFDYRPFEEK